MHGRRPVGLVVRRVRVRGEDRRVEERPVRERELYISIKERVGGPLAWTGVAEGVEGYTHKTACEVDTDGAPMFP